MSKITITVNKNARIADFNVTYTDAAGTLILKHQSDFTKGAPGIYTWVEGDFNAGASMQTSFTVFGAGNAIGSPLAYAKFNLDGADLTPSLTGQIFAGQNQATSQFNFPLSPAAQANFAAGHI